MGLWSRFWSVVPKAVVKSGRDAFERAKEPVPAASDDIDVEAVSASLATPDEQSRAGAASTTDSDAAASPSTPDQNTEDRDEAPPRTRTL